MQNLDLDSYAIIKSPVNVLNVDYYLAIIESELDLLANAVVVYSNEINANSRTRVWDLKDLESRVRILRYFSLDSTVYVPFFSDLNSLAGISQKSILELMYKLIQAPVYIVDTPIIQDTYIKSGRPTLNYGKGQSLMIGTALDGINRSFMEIDLSHYLELEDAVVLSADLILNISGSYDPNLIIDVYPVHTTWIETNVTWNSSQAMNIGSNPLFSFKCNSSTVRIPVLDYVNFLKAQNDSNFNIMFRARDELSVSSIPFFSKDTSISNYRPKLEIRYQDLTWMGNLGDQDILGNATIRAKDSRDLLSEPSVRRKGYKDLGGSSLIGRWENADLNSYSSTLGKAYLDSDSFIVYSKDLDGSVNVYSDVIATELDSSCLLVYNKDLDGNVTAAPTKDLHGDVHVRVTTFIDQIANTIITQYKQIDGQVDIKATENLLSDAIIELAKILDGDALVYAIKQLISTVRITIKNDIDGTANIWQKNYLDSEATVVYSKDLDSLVEVSGGLIYIDGNANVRGRLDLASSARVFYSSDIDGHSDIWQKKDLLGSAVTYHKKDLDGLVDLIPNINLDSFANITHSINLDSDITIRRSSLFDMYCEAMIGIWSFDIDTTSNVPARWNLPSDALIVYSKDLASDAIIRSPGFIDLLPDITIRQKADYDLLVEAIIRRLDISEIDTFAFIDGWYGRSLLGDAIVRRIGRFYLNGTATVRNNARIWIPDEHGGDVFGKGDKKLPRVWIRELFIP